MAETIEQLIERLVEETQVLPQAVHALRAEIEWANRNRPDTPTHFDPAFHLRTFPKDPAALDWSQRLNALTAEATAPQVAPDVAEESFAEVQGELFS